MLAQISDWFSPSQWQLIGCCGIPAGVIALLIWLLLRGRDRNQGNR
jgi:hypothetical protein